MDSRQSRRSRRSNDSTVYTPRRLSVTLSNAKAKASARLRAAGLAFGGLVGLAGAAALAALGPERSA